MSRVAQRVQRAGEQTGVARLQPGQRGAVERQREADAISASHGAPPRPHPRRFAHSANDQTQVQRSQRGFPQCLRFGGWRRRRVLRYASLRHRAKIGYGGKRGVHGREQLLFERAQAVVGRGLVHRPHERPLRQAGHLVERGADADAHHERRAGVGALLAHAAYELVDDALLAGTRNQHDHAARVVRAAALQHNVQPRRARLVHGMDVAERRRVVARVRAVEDGIAHHRLAQARLVVGAGDGVVHVGEHVAAYSYVRPDLEADPHGAGVLADRHAILGGDRRVLN